MRFQEIKLYALDEIDKDALDNPVYGEVLIGIYQGRITQWTVEEIALLDRTLTTTQRKLLTDAPINVIRQAERIAIGDDKYNLIDVKSDFIRWRLCHIKEFFT